MNAIRQDIAHLTFIHRLRNAIPPSQPARFHRPSTDTKVETEDLRDALAYIEQLERQCGASEKTS